MSLSKIQFNNDVHDLAAGGILTISLNALRHNYQAVAKQIAPARAAAVVKADCYGLGADKVAPAFYQAGCRDFFVAHLSEALKLRPLLADDAMLYVLNGLQPQTEEICADAQIIPVLNSIEQLENWQKLAIRRNATLPALLQVDTGMARLGLSPDELDHLARHLNLLTRLDIKYIISHLAVGDEFHNPFNAQQLETMQAALARLPKTPVAFANSGACFQDKSFHFNLARPGVVLYGVGPDLPDHPILPVAELSARVIQVRNVRQGTPVGYGCTYVTPKPMRIATIAVGYADGLFRSLSNKGSAFYKDTRLPIIGRVSMDSITLDVSDLAEGTLKLGSLVELIGPHQSLEDLARDCDTIPYEILTALGQRYQRIYID